MRLFLRHLLGRSSPHGTLRIFCSCDRNNYGDLLFSILTQRALRHLLAPEGRWRFANYGLVSSHLTSLGALPSRSLRELYEDANSGDVVLLAGGENLAQGWLGMHLTLLDPTGVQERLRFAQQHPRRAESDSRRFLHGRQHFPYILSPRQFPRGVRVMYNSVGGWPLANYDAHGKRIIADALLQSTFLSVRDENSAALLRAIDSRLSPRVAPDLVFLLPTLLPIEELRRNAGPWFGETVPRLGRFVCFQCNPRYGDANRSELAHQLTRLHAVTGLPILLLPIGGIYPFEDRRFLQSFAADLGPSAHIPPEDASVFDTAYALASCSLFCGTSLHGIITALTFGSPFVALENEDPKVPFNIASWGLQSRLPAVPAARLDGQAQAALSSDPAWLASEVARLQQSAAANLEHLARAIG